MRLIIAGTRTFDDYDFLKKKLDKILANEVKECIEFISGGANGADALGERYAKEHGVIPTTFEADWTQHGKAAGPIRNQQMVLHSSHAIFFWDERSKGTASCIKLAQDAGLKVRIIYYNRPEPVEKPKRELYRPSNGTEGMGFEECFCMNCLHTDPNPEGKKQCEIWMRALMYDTGDPQYPLEWTYDALGHPTCTAHVNWDWGTDGDPDDDNNPKRPVPPPDLTQLNLFPLWPDETAFDTKPDLSPVKKDLQPFD